MNVFGPEYFQNLDMRDLINLMEKTFKLYKAGEAYMPPKVYLDVPEGDFRAMPAVVGKYAGIKWASVHPGNKDDLSDIPTVQAKMILNDIETGMELAVMDGAAITCLRTAAVTGLATDFFSMKTANAASFIGCGAQTIHQIMAVMAVRQIKRIDLYDLDKNAALDLKTNLDLLLGDSGTEVKVHNNIDSCCANANIITTLTSSTVPFLNPSHLNHEGVHVNAIGADAEGKRECFDKLYDQFCYIVVDDKEQAFHSGESQYLSKEQKQKVVEMKDVIGVKHALRQDEMTMFDSTGLAIEDVALASYVYEKALP